jgi:hypoxanthine phosphoribosyltransferase
MIGENMFEDIKNVILSQEDISDIVKDLGKKISEDYKGKDLLVVSILKGSVLFMADLMREITIPCNIDFMAVSSYGSGTVSSGEVKIIKDLDKPIEGKELLIVEDILDSGKTLSYIMSILKARNPKSIEICTLFDKPDRREAQVYAKYIGSNVPNEFIVGYGLDYNEYYRNLPFIGALKESVYSK